MTGYPYTYQESWSYADELKRRFLKDRETRGQAELEYEKVDSPRRTVFHMAQTAGSKVLVKWECWNGDAKEFTAQSVEDSVDLARGWIAQNLNEPLREYYEFLTE